MKVLVFLSLALALSGCSVWQEYVVRRDAERAHKAYEEHMVDRRKFQAWLMENGIREPGENATCEEVCMYKSEVCAAERDAYCELKRDNCSGHCLLDRRATITVEKPAAVGQGDLGSK